MSNTYPMISVIIPVYKVEKYIDKCIESLVHQTYDNYEIILVDDGSPDNCGAICDQYSKDYPYISVIHQGNSGQAAARNNAVKTAHGEYIAFIDSDDYVEPDYLEYLMTLLQNYHADAAIGGFEYLYEGAEPKINGAEFRETPVLMDANTALKRMNYTQGFGAAVWSKLFRKELICAHPFPEGQIYEDLAVMYRIIGDCNRVVLGSRCIYHWIQRQGSTMRMSFDERQMAALDASGAQVLYMEQNRPEVLDSAKARHEAKIVELMSTAMNGKDSRKIYDRLKKRSRYYREVMGDPNVKRTVKLRMAAIRIGYLPAKLVFKLHEKAKERKFS